MLLDQWVTRKVLERTTGCGELQVEVEVEVNWNWNWMVLDTVDLRNLIGIYGSHTTYIAGKDGWMDGGCGLILSCLTSVVSTPFWGNAVNKQKSA